MKEANLALRFLLEIVVLVALGYWGFRTGGGVLWRALLGIGAPLLAAVLWGTFGSPKAALPATGIYHLLLEVVVFGSGVVALYAAGRPTLAWVFGLVILGNRLLMAVWHQ